MQRSGTRARRSMSLREERSASEAYRSSKRSWALMNRARWPFWSALSMSPVARPDLPTPVGPMKTMLVAVGMKSSSARLMIWRLLTPGCSLKGNVSNAHRSAIRLRCKFLSSCWSSSIGRLIVGISWGRIGMQGELEVGGGDTAQDHALEAAEVVEAVVGRGLDGREQGLARGPAGHPHALAGRPPAPEL